MSALVSDLQSLLKRIETENESDSAIKILSDFLRRRLVQRLSTSEQKKRLYKHYITRNIKALQEFAQFSQFPSVQESVADYIVKIECESHTPNGVLHLPDEAQQCQPN